MGTHSWCLGSMQEGLPGGSALVVEKRPLCRKWPGEARWKCKVVGTQAWALQGSSVDTLHPPFMSCGLLRTDGMCPQEVVSAPTLVCRAAARGQLSGAGWFPRSLPGLEQLPLSMDRQTWGVRCACQSGGRAAAAWRGSPSLWPQASPPPGSVHFSGSVTVWLPFPHLQATPSRGVVSGGSTFRMDPEAPMPAAATH